METISPLPAPAPKAGISTLLAGIFTVSPELAVVAVDPEFRIIFVNGAAERLFGYAASAVLGQSIPDIHDRLGLPNPPFYRAAEKVRGGVCHHFPQRVTLSDGDHHLESHMIALFEGSTLAGYALLSRDVTAQRQAQTHEQLLARTMAHSPAAIIVTNDNGIVEFVNRRFTEITGYEASEVVGKRAGSIRSGKTPPEIYRELWETIRAGREWSGRLLNRHRNGDYRWHAVRIMPIFGQSGTIEHYVSVQEDITERIQTEERLRLWARMLNESGEGVMITDARNRIVSVNRAFTEITGYSAREVVGQTPHILSSGRHDEAFFADMWRTLGEAGRWQGEIWDRRKNGEIYPKWLGISAVNDDQGQLTHYLAVFSDISERKAAEERIAFMAYHDPLTRLPNRLLLRDRFDQAIAFARRSGNQVALLFLDLDRFKHINDTLGHLVGDHLLLGVVERLRQCIRQTDTLSRQGGDEFAIVLAEVSDANAVAEIAQKILDSFATPLLIDGHPLSTTFSIGISLFPDDGTDFDTLFKKADTAMYSAKEAGRNAYHFFASQMDDQIGERLVLHTRLAQALVSDQLLLHYQPLVDLANGRIVGAEALLRWSHPELGMMPPGRFIPLAEDTGYIVPFGAWVLREACRQAAAWRQAGHDLTIAVNLSAVQFRRGALLDTVRGALEASGLPPDRLELELTESILLHDTEKVLAIVDQLKAMGIRLSLDDFGTGYSSLAYLKRFPVDKLKIDRSFIRDIETDPEDAVIVRTILQMARNLRLVTVAEGVETRPQKNFLWGEGCDIAQGYYYSPPVDAAAFTRLLNGKTAA